MTDIKPRLTPMARDTTDLHLVPWTDPVVEHVGFPLRHPYVEAFWTPVLGPKCILMLRRFALGFTVNPDGFTLTVDYLANALGLGDGRGRHSPIEQALYRVQAFGAAERRGTDTLAVRQYLAPLSAGQLRRLLPELRAEHDAALRDWSEGR